MLVARSEVAVSRFRIMWVELRGSRERCFPSCNRNNRNLSERDVGAGSHLLEPGTRRNFAMLRQDRLRTAPGRTVPVRGNPSPCAGPGVVRGRVRHERRDSALPRLRTASRTLAMDRDGAVRDLSDRAGPGPGIRRTGIGRAGQTGRRDSGPRAVGAGLPRHDAGRRLALDAVRRAVPPGSRLGSRAGGRQCMDAGARRHRRDVDSPPPRSGHVRRFRTRSVRRWRARAVERPPPDLALRDPPRAGCGRSRRDRSRSRDGLTESPCDSAELRDTAGGGR